MARRRVPKQRDASVRESGHLRAAGHGRNRRLLQSRPLQAVARGRTNAEIGAELFISLSTVKSHLASIHTKLRARNRVEVANWAWSTGRMRTQ